jgi:hypothetical protein
MQQGSALPFAVMYITVQGRRHSDHGLSSVVRARLSPGSAAPEALKPMPSARATASAAARCCASSWVSRANRAWSGLARP